MAAMLQSLGKKVAIVTDERAIDMNRSILEKAVEQGMLGCQYRLPFKLLPLFFMKAELLSKAKLFLLLQ